jgi:hypothetical protein
MMQTLQKSCAHHSTGVRLESVKPGIRPVVEQGKSCSRSSLWLMGHRY